jgi:hypothetical protein
MPPFLPASGTVALLPMGNFDIDLDFGLIHEDKVKDIFQGKGSIEVKTERDMWSRTGNMAVEITYKGKPSGITITDAEWWCHLFTIDGDIKFVLMMRVKELKERIKQLARTNFVKIVKGGDNDDSEIILVPIQKVVGYTWK